MRFSIRHSTHYTYDSLGSFAVQRLRLTPKSNVAQTVLEWRIEAPGIDKAAGYVDGFGNQVHLITHCRPYDQITITAEGEVETTETGGTLGELSEAANPLVFLRPTPLTEASQTIEAMADGLGGRHLLDRLHHLLEAIATRVAYDTDASNSVTSASEAFAAGQGVCQDHAHIFIAAARRLRIPARYVTGYLHMESEASAVANHAWAEAYVQDLGWVGFDPANHICPTERYVRLACGFDAVSAAPVTGTRRGGGAESLAVDVIVRQQQQ
ncbi:MAG: transglutaminase family protein [Rhizobiales bacterium]|nr:transglutaminase family protein [Hyphomicrobiales bacterium]